MGIAQLNILGSGKALIENDLSVCHSEIKEGNMVKVCFVGLYNERNVGDPIIGDCVEWLYGKALQNKTLQVKRVALDWLSYHPTLLCKIAYRLRRFARKPFYGIFHRVLAGEYSRFFGKEIENSQLVVVVGGGLIKYTTQYFGTGLRGLLNAAKKKHIGVVFNAVGVEGYDSANSRCIELKRLLRIRSLQSVTTRDDIETLKRDYFAAAPAIPCSLVCDPGVWASEVYEISKDETSRTIGIGVCREEMFTAHGYNITPLQLIGFYKDLVKALMGKGKRVELFTNGLPEDNETAKKIQQELNEESITVALQTPFTARELVEIESKYEAVVAARLHACIVAYSLCVPAVGLVWNDKLTFFGRNIGAEPNFIKAEEIRVEHVVSCLERALCEGYNAGIRDTFRGTIVDDINATIFKYLDINPHMDC